MAISTWKPNLPRDVVQKKKLGSQSIYGIYHYKPCWMQPSILLSIVMIIASIIGPFMLPQAEVSN
jgi:hypothetical protein